MENYLEKIRAVIGRTPLVSPASKDICPFLLYNLTPYIFTLAEGGWFNWVKKHKNREFRKIIDKRDFKNKAVNRLYPNEVMVRCPNPYSNVTAGLGLWEDAGMKIRILDRDGVCLNNHNPDDEFIMSCGSAAVQALNFNDTFPESLSLSVVNQEAREISKLCPKEEKIIVRTEEVIFPCRYHIDKRPLGEDLLPGGFCMHIFQRIYPFVLAMMYNAPVADKISLNCPLNNCCVTLKLRKTGKNRSVLLSRPLNVLRKIFETFFYPVDIIDYDFVVSVIDIKNNSSNCRLSKGGDFPVNLGSRDHICPAAFHAMYPYLSLAECGKAMVWGKQTSNSNLMPCPDCVGVVYSVSGKSHSQHL